MNSFKANYKSKEKDVIFVFLTFDELRTSAAQKIKFFTKDFFIKCDQIRRKLRIWSHLLKKSFKAKFIFCAVSMHFSIILPDRYSGVAGPYIIFHRIIKSLE